MIKECNKRTCNLHQLSFIDKIKYIYIYLNPYFLKTIEKGCCLSDLLSYNLPD